MIFSVPQSQKAFLSYIKSDSTSVCYFVQEFKDAIVAQQQMRARASAAPATKRASSNSKANEQTKQVLTETWKLIMRCVDDDEKSFKKSIEVLFSMFDRDGDGTIDIAELTRGLSALGVNLSPAQVAALRDTMDTDQDGTISMSEFMTALERERARLTGIRSKKSNGPVALSREQMPRPVRAGARGNSPPQYDSYRGSSIDRPPSTSSKSSRYSSKSAKSTVSNPGGKKTSPPLRNARNRTTER